MCYTGKCPYELTSGDFVGDCKFNNYVDIPPGAPCSFDAPEGVLGSGDHFEDAVEKIKSHSEKKGRFWILALSD
jgi:hypothetical protein